MIFFKNGYQNKFDVKVTQELGTKYALTSGAKISVFVSIYNHNIQR